MSVERRVQKGIEFLDKQVAKGRLPSSWRRAVDPDTLQMDSVEQCILGQLEAMVPESQEEKYVTPYLKVVSVWELNDQEAWTMGFDGGDIEDYRELETEWRKALV